MDLQVLPFSFPFPPPLLTHFHMSYLDNLRQFGESAEPEHSVASLKKNFASLADALDAAPSELGAGHYKKAKQKTLTIKHLKRKKMPDLLAVFEQGKKITQDEDEAAAAAADKDAAASGGEITVWVGSASQTDRDRQTDGQTDRWMDT